MSFCSTLTGEVLLSTREKNPGAGCYERSSGRQVSSVRRLWRVSAVLWRLSCLFRSAIQQAESTKHLSLLMSNPFRRSVEIVVVLLCKVGDMGIYGKRRDVESGILVGLFRGELYCDGVFLPRFEIDGTGRSEDRAVKQDFCHSKTACCTGG